MYLKQIELENFKSFGKKLILPLLEGYTAVTGPNGSGKSNISDAILFVLGPKSSRVIRAGRLPDLIFNGGDSKRPANYCKVSLIFDNKDRLIPIDDDLVRLTRMVKMSSDGESYSSYFYVNDRKSTLGEFDILLSNARISADGYNFVQQGDITHITTMSNLERRRIFDEISGISKFDEEIEKAKAERDEVDANIERISIILDELVRQIDQLEQEKEVALTYFRMKDLLTLSRAQMAYRRRESTEAEAAALQKQIEGYERDIQSLKDRRQELADNVRDLDFRMVQTEQELQAKGGKEFLELRTQIDELKIRVAKAEDRSAQALQSADEADEERLRKTEECGDVLENIASLSQLREEKALKLSACAAELKARRKELDDIQSELSDCDEELAALEKEITRLDKDLRAKEDRINQMLMEKERLEGRKERLGIDLAGLDEEIGILDFEIVDTEEQIRLLKNQERGSARELKELQEKYLSLKSAEARMSREAGELEQAIRSLVREQSRIKAEEEAAGDIARGYNRAVRGVIEARDSRAIRGIHGTIAELAEVDPKYQTALNIAAGGRMQAIVVDDDQVAAECIHYLKRNEMGRATFLPLNKMMGGRPRGKAILAAKDATGFAIDLVRFDEHYRAAFWYVFGDTVVVETLDQARRLMGGVRLVTLGGELLEASGAMVGGNMQASRLKFGSSSKGRLEEVSAQLDRAILASENLGEELVNIREELVTIEGQIRELSGTGGASGVTLRALESRKGEVSSKLDQVKKERIKKAEELEQLAQTIVELDGQITASDVEMEQCRAKRDKAREVMERLAPTEMSVRLKDLQSQVVELTGSVAELNAAVETLDAKIQLNQGHVNVLREEEAQLKEKAENLRRESQEMDQEGARAKTELAALRKIEDSMGAEMNKLRQRKEALFREKTALEGERDGLQNRVETTTDIIVGLRTRIGQCQDKLRELEEEISQYGIVITPPIPSQDSLRDTIRQCEVAIAEMGAVNLRAVDDYEERKGRHDALSGEIEHLEAQRNDLLSLEGDLNEKKKVSLYEVYEAVNANFKRCYNELSQGGEAELILENPEEPFEAGLIMRARPRQGKVLRLEALSGGEKSLAALAFIFAIQEYQPSPFYLLDEVDMFLDGINADMVARRVQKSSKTAQFVQISLRKITLTKADHIIGVTKQDGGISRVIVRPNISDIKDFQTEFNIPEENIEEGTQ